MKKYTIVAITQINNELRKGNLERFFKYINGKVDHVVVYDDMSTDGSYEYAQKYTTYTIRGVKNNFVNEWQIKEQLVKKALTLKPDFILHIDADEVLAGTKSLEDLADWVTEKNIDGAYLHNINLWRSRSWKRVDSDFDTVHAPRFWRVKGGVLTYTNRTGGLHQSPLPDQIQRFEKQDMVCLLHFGFADEKNIVAKYYQYAKRGQKGENLARLINEEGILRTEKVDLSLYPNGLWEDDIQPISLTGVEWYQKMALYKNELTKPAISVVCLIYQSIEWLQFVYDQVLKHTDLSDKEFFFVANDATPEVKAYLHDNYIPHYIFDNTEEHRKEWYINNVYRAWNYGGQMAKGDFIVFVNSDMAFSPGWVESLFAKYDGKSCLNARLVESGNLPTGGLCIEKNFGRHFIEYKEKEFLDYIETVKEPITKDGGAFMPLLIKTDDFLSVGGYPEGNIKKGSDFFNPVIAEKGEELISGDVVLMGKLKEKRNVIHKTVFDSFSYHFQEGEKRDGLSYEKEKKDTQVVIVNNSLHGRMKEKVLWNFLLERLPATSGVDYEIVGGNELTFKAKAAEYINTHFPKTKIVIQNASFIDLVRPDLYTFAFLQDNLRKMKRISPQQEEVLRQASGYVSNSAYTAASYLEYLFNIIPIGVDTELFKPGNKSDSREKHAIPKEKKVGIFVGDLSEIKGWTEVRTLIEKRDDIYWIIVTKGEENYVRNNVSFFRQVPQATLTELYQAADFFLIGSQVETLCLAAMEANCSNTPVIMRKIGVYSDFSQADLDACGIFGDHFEQAIDSMSSKNFSPRACMIRKGLTIDTTISMWWKIIAEAKLRQKIYQEYVPPKYTLLSFFKHYYKMIFNKTFVIIMARKYLGPATYEKTLKLWRRLKKTFS